MLKLLTINKETNILINVIQHEEETILECSNLAVIVKNLDKNLVNTVVDAIKGDEDFLHILSSNHEKAPQGLQGITKELYLTDFTNKGTDLQITTVPRYTGEQHIITDTGVYEVNSIDLSLEYKYFRINISGEYNDLQVVPKKGTSYVNLHNVLNGLLETKVIDFRTESGIIEIQKVKFELKNI